MATGTIRAPARAVNVEARRATFSIQAGGVGTVSLDVYKQGYTAVGIAGVEVNNNHVMIYRWYVSANNANMQLQNSMTTAYTDIPVIFYVLYVKND